MQQYQSLGEIRYFNEKKQLALHFVKQHPLFTLGVTARRFTRFWTGFWSWDRRYLQREPFDIPNPFFCTALTFFAIRGVRRWWSLDHATALRYLILLTVFPLAYYLTHSSMDYRQPIEPEILILVTVGIFGLGDEPDYEISEEEETAMATV